MRIRKPRSPISKAKSNLKRNAKKAVIPGYGKGGATAFYEPEKYIKKKGLRKPLFKMKKTGLFSFFK